MEGPLNIRWVVQSNLLSEDDVNSLKRACDLCGAEFFPVEVVPFSSELPDIKSDEKDNIYYGSTTFIERVDRELEFPKGIFFCSTSFQMSNYISKWGVHVLNSSAKLTNLSECLISSHSSDVDLFVRPNADDKSFAGEVMSKEGLTAWANRVKRNEENERNHGNVPALTMETPILVGPAYRIEKEWRNFIVDGRVISSTLYRQDHKLKKRRESPQGLMDFVHERCKEYVPHRIFVMDIALCGNSYYIIECGCLNSAGFYDADIDEIVKVVSRSI